MSSTTNAKLVKLNAIKGKGQRRVYTPSLEPKKKTRLDKIKASVPVPQAIIRVPGAPKRALNPAVVERVFPVLTQKQYLAKIKKTKKVLEKIKKEELKAKKHIVVLHHDPKKEALLKKKVELVEKYLERQIGGLMLMYNKAKKNKDVRVLKYLAIRSDIDIGKLVGIKGEFPQTKDEKIRKLIEQIDKLRLK